MDTRVIVLGAGFGGLELTTRLSDALGDDVDITLIDQSDSFVFGFSKLDVMFGSKGAEEVRLYYRDILKPGVRFRRERIESIDPGERRIVTDQGTYEADVLVVALGADLDPAATPGLDEGGHEFYSVEGAEKLRGVIPSFDSGIAIVGVLGPFFKCPPAPFEAAMMLHDHLRRRGAADAVTIRVLSPLSSPIPVSAEASEGVLHGLLERGIEFWPESKVTSLDASTRTATLADGRTVDYDLFLGVPVHRAPAVVEASGLTVDGWIPVDTASFATSFPDVYAIGDVTSAPVPRAGVFAEGEAATLADFLISKLLGGEPPPQYAGVAACYVEFGGGEVAKVDVEFMPGAAPTGRFQGPSEDIAAEKEAFAATRKQRWFGPSAADIF
jgi:sulfide:quinone oxidoreductase